MTFVATLILLFVALALVVSVAFRFTRTRRVEVGHDHSAEGTQEVESHLLRRPLRSRYTA